MDKGMDGVIRYIGIDQSSGPSISVTETYSRDGKHLGTVWKQDDGTVTREEGPCEAKNTIFFPTVERTPIPETEKFLSPPEVPRQAIEYASALLRMSETICGLPVVVSDGVPVDALAIVSKTEKGAATSLEITAPSGVIVYNLKP